MTNMTSNAVNKRLLAIIVLLASLVQPAQAASYHLLDGELIGAFDVEVNGQLYDVSFANGSCATLYSGCDELSDFMFGNPVDSQAAASALLKQVFSNGDFYDTNPALTRGCESDVCFLMMPYLLSDNPNFIGYANVKGGRNSPALAENLVGFSIIDPDLDISAFPDWTFVRWTTETSVIPLPASIWLFGMVLMGMLGGASTRNSRRRAG